jgi:hypothetical protein
MTELVLSGGIEIGRMALDISIDNGGDEGWGKIGVIAIIRPRDYVDECRKISRENGIG